MTSDEQERLSRELRQIGKEWWWWTVVLLVLGLAISCAGPAAATVAVLLMLASIAFGLANVTRYVGRALEVDDEASEAERPAPGAKAPSRVHPRARIPSGETI